MKKLESLEHDKKNNMLHIKLKNDPVIYHLAIEEIPRAILGLENDEI